MTKVSGGEFERYVIDGGFPGFWEFVTATPLQAVFSGETCVGLFPECGGVWIPHSLSAGAIEDDLTKAFEFPAVATV